MLRGQTPGQQQSVRVHDMYMCMHMCMHMHMYMCMHMYMYLRVLHVHVHVEADSIAGKELLKSTDGLAGARERSWAADRRHYRGKGGDKGKGAAH